jgi:16S rRNA (cytosine967-C5)-methyltransferase
MTVVDLCAGGGRQDAGLAAEMANQGRIVASDTDRGRLSRMAPRLHRAGVSIVEPLLLNPGSELAALDDLQAGADIVLVDAPCSGTGTCGAIPRTRWRLNADRLARLVRLQSDLLDIAAELVRPGGVLVYAYARCSPRREGDRRRRSAPAVHPSFHKPPISPAADVRVPVIC